MNIITPSEVVEYAFSHREEISPSSIRPTKIDVAAERFVRPRFGDDLYEKFVEGDYSPFVDEYLKPAVAHYVRYVLIDDLSIQMTDNGAVLFEREILESQHSKLTAAKNEEQSTQSGNESTVNQQDVNTVKSHEGSAKTSVDGSVRRTFSDEGSVHTVDVKSGRDTVTKESDTKAVVDKSESVNSEKTVNDKTIVDNDKQRDYQFHESPQTVGVSTVGESFDRIDEEKTVTGTHSETKSVNGDSTTTTEFDGSDIKVWNGNNDSQVTKDSSGSSLNTTNQVTNQERSSEESADQKTTGTRTLSVDREVSQNSSRRSTDDGSEHKARRQMRPATDLQRKIIRARALADANILMAKAVRYVERNSELFPEYEPQPRSFGRIVL